MRHVQRGDVRLHVSHELLEVLRRKVLPRHDQDRRSRHQADGCKVRIRLVGKVGIERDRSGVGSHVTHLDRVAVRRGARGSGRGGGAAGPDHVLDDDRLPQRAGHVVAGNAGNDVGRPAGGKRHDQRDRALRKIGLRRGGSRGKAERDGGGNRSRQYLAHGRPSFMDMFLGLRSMRECYHHAADICCPRAAVTCRSRSVAAAPSIRRRLRRGAAAFWAARRGSAE